MKTPNKLYWYKSERTPNVDWQSISFEQYDAMTTDGKPKPNFRHLTFKVEDMVEAVQPTQNAEIKGEEQPTVTNKRGGGKNKNKQ